jgi:hypothetical protein
MIIGSIIIHINDSATSVKVVFGLLMGIFPGSTNGSDHSFSSQFSEHKNRQQGHAATGPDAQQGNLEPRELPTTTTQAPLIA